MITRSLLTVPYQLTRTPLALVDVQLVRRLPEDSMPRLMCDRILGSYDQLAGRLLFDPDLARRGADRVARSGKIAHAVGLERDATQRRDAAATIAAAGERQAAEVAQQAQARLEAGLEDADAAERDGKDAAAASARAAAARKKKQAEQRTARRLAGIEQEVSRAETVASTRATGAQQTAKAKLDDAADERAKAGAKREQADQLAELTTAKQQSRLQS
jgi:hypothetical protein